MNARLGIVLMLIGWLFVFAACSGTDEAQRARLIKTEPQGSTLHPFRRTIELIFTDPVRKVIVDDVPSVPNDSAPALVWTASLDHLDSYDKPGSHPRKFICLSVTYEDDFGKRIEELCGWLPHTVIEYPLPRIINGTVKDGDRNVDFQQLNRDGITFLFNKPILPERGHIEIRPTEGEPLNWKTVWTPESVKITPLADTALKAGVTYLIEIIYQDAKGDRVEETISFTTLPD